MRHSNNSYPARLGIYTQKILKPVFKKRGLMEGKVITHWPQIVGERFSKIALAEKITFPAGKKTGGTLHLSVTSSGAMMLHYAQDLILDQVNTFFGYKALSKLRMTHGLVWRDKPAPAKKPERPLTNEEEGWIKSAITTVQDSELKECLERIGTCLCR